MSYALQGQCVCSWALLDSMVVSELHSCCLLREHHNNCRIYLELCILFLIMVVLLQAWKDVSELARDFIDKLLVLDPEKRMTADEALKHCWIASSAASSSLKNLHGSFSQNWLKSSTSRVNSAKSHCSQKSNKSVRSGKSAFSVRQSNCATFPRDSYPPPKAHSQKGSDKQKSSGLKDSNVKLTRQLVEKLHSVINEDDRELFPIKPAEDEPTDITAGTCLTDEENIRESVDKSEFKDHVLKVEQDQTEHASNSSKDKEGNFLNQSGEHQELTREMNIPGVSKLQLSPKVMHDNFLTEKPDYKQRNPSDSMALLGSFNAVSSCKLSPVARSNKVFCSTEPS